jgi:hypothetical protein
MKTLNARVADVIGVDRTVPRSMAEAHGWRVPPLYEGQSTGPEWKVCLRIDGELITEVVDVPEARLLPQVSGSRDVNDRYYAHVGRALAARHPEVEAAINAYRRLPKDYDADWAALASLRAWVLAGGPERILMFHVHLLSTRGVEAGAAERPDVWSGEPGPTVSMVRVLAATLAARPVDWCNAVLSTVTEESGCG